MSTEDHDMGYDSDFRAFVRNFRIIGFGRMQQIVDEEWRRADPKRGGLLTLCRNCDTLLNSVSGEPRMKPRALPRSPRRRP